MERVSVARKTHRPCWGLWILRLFSWWSRFGLVCLVVRAEVLVGEAIDGDDDTNGNSDGDKISSLRGG